MLLLALGAAVWASVGWYRAAHDTTAAYSRDRDAALAAGEQAVQNLNTLDQQHLAAGLALWDSSTTGSLHTQLAQGRAPFLKQVKQAKTSTTAKVLSAALTELDDRAGRAQLMVALKVTVTAPGQQATAKTERLTGQLTRVHGGRWLLSDLGQAPTDDGSTQQ
nr:hypothetical protein [Mangrovactinospora gilvigrisea]